MSTTELKNKVSERLESIQQTHLLEETLNFIDIKSSEDEVFKIPEEHKADLEMSLKQKKDGETIPNDVVNETLQIK